ncbi:MAG: hypothetical protein KGY66_06605 [Candidatus Thermoplasmatota archaeon]|nr:hypothetical protein [Candidatus Thermoplasmatota archaeon]MBS3790569.1 hypothetical protein [Candidatus Thermoplasmatota archaeon]
MELECKSCGYEWDYQGESDYYATCPNCQYKVKIEANAEVIEPEGKEEKANRDVGTEIGIPAKAKVVPSGAGTTRFSGKEEIFLEQIAELDDPDEIYEIFSKYEQEEFNSLRKKVKEKAIRLRNDLKKYKKIENLLEEKGWEYSER